MSLKRLTLRAKQSVSKLIGDLTASPTSPTQSHDNEQEHDHVDLEEFGVSTSTTSSTFFSSDKTATSSESPSRKKKLMGSLRSIGSMMSLRLSPSKVKLQKDAAIEAEESSSPSRIIRPSLTLDFEECPTDRPMFGTLRHKRSDSSSLFVQHSSPVAVPGASKDVHARTPANSLDLPGGTIPDTPAPLQVLLDLEAANKESPPDSVVTPWEASSSRAPVGTPMPGANFTMAEFDISYVDGSVAASSSLNNNDQLDYFSIDPKHVPRRPLRRSNDKVLLEASIKLLDDAVSNIAATKPHLVRSSSTVKPHPTDTRSSASARCSSPPSGIPGSFRNCTPPSYQQTAPDTRYKTTCGNATQYDIRHVIYDRERSPVPQVVPTNSPTSEGCRSDWGHSSGLYDGSGYGRDSEAGTPQSVASKGAEGVNHTTTENARDLNIVSASKLSVDLAIAEADAVTSDHEALEAVIRAYAVYENTGLHEDDFDTLYSEETTITTSEF